MTRQKYLKSVFLAAGLAAGTLLSPPVLAIDYDLRGYLGYVGVASDEETECKSRACQGVLEDAFFYGLSATAQGEHLGAQVIISQDEDEQPDISLAQGTLRGQLLGLDANLRAGKIIVPLGLYGSQRITPTARPGLVFPQSLLLNAYYDLLTLSEEGVGFDLRGDRFGFKSAIYEPEDVTLEREVTVPGEPGPLDFLLGGILGLDLLTGIGGTPDETMTVQENERNKAGYLGFDYQSNGYKADIGWVAQEINDQRVDAYNLGYLNRSGNFQSSLEVFRLEIEDQAFALDGLSLGFLYSAAAWQVFLNGVQMDFAGNTSTEIVVGGVYYWAGGDLSTRLNWHRLDGGLPGAVEGIEETDAVTLAIAYSWD